MYEPFHASQLRLLSHNDFYRHAQTTLSQLRLIQEKACLDILTKPLEILSSQHPAKALIQNYCGEFDIELHHRTHGQFSPQYAPFCLQLTDLSMISIFERL